MSPPSTILTRTCAAATSRISTLTNLFGSRSFASSVADGGGVGAADIFTRGLIEIREYTIQPGAVSQYAKLAVEYSDARKTLLPLLG